MKLSKLIAGVILGFSVLILLALFGLLKASGLQPAEVVWAGLSAGLVIVGSACIWLILQFRILRPLKTLSAAVTRVRLGDLSQAVPVDAHDEVSELSRNFNDMTQQLVASQRTLTDARKLAEERLAELESSINSLRQGFIITDDAGRVLQANEAVRNLFTLIGHSYSSDPKELPTIEHIATLFPENTRLAETLTHSIQAKEIAKFTALPYGDGRFMDLYISPVVDGDKSIGSALLFEDVTEERIMQRSRDEFFSIASHELRTPLTAIRGNMSIAKDYFKDNLKGTDLKDIVEDTHAASVRLIEIVNDFLDSSRLEQGKMVFSFAPVQLAPLIDAIIDDLKPLREQQHNKMTAEDLDKLPPVWADEGRLRQILYNLISNANKYSEHAKITVSGASEGANVRIRVADTGKGISAENQKLLFHKFQQAGSSLLTRDDTKGTGLGLYISKLLATNMKGDVMLEQSAEGKGSTFALLMPIATSGPQQQR